MYYVNKAYTRHRRRREMERRKLNFKRTNIVANFILFFFSSKSQSIKRKIDKSDKPLMSVLSGETAKPEETQGSRDVNFGSHFYDRINMGFDND